MYRLELIGRHHDREAFDCGNEALNSYLRQTARQHTESGISRTFVLVEEDGPEPRPILGFFPLNICQLKGEAMPQPWAKRLPREVSGIKLGRLAVARGRQRQGLGRILLVAAMRMVLEVFEAVGGIGLFVDAKDEAARAYCQRFGFERLPDKPLQLFLPLGTIRQALAEDY